MKTTLRDIAGHLNVSTALVSQVLNDKPGNWASEATRQRVRETALELNYRPSASARALVTGRTMQIAVALELRPGNNIFGSHLHGLIEMAGARRYRVTMIPLQDRESGARQLEELALEHVCDGMCLFSSMSDASYLRALEARRMPTVVIGDLPHELENQARFAVCVDYDNYRIGHDAAAWLMKQNHKRIAWVYAPGEAVQPHVRELRRGYEAALTTGSTPLYLQHCPDLQTQIDTALKQGAMAAIVRSRPYAMLWARALLERGLSSDKFQLMALMDEDDLSLMQQAGLAHEVAFLAWSAKRVGQTAAKALLDWIETGQPAAHSILVAPNAPTQLASIEILDWLNSLKLNQLKRTTRPKEKS